VLNKIKIDSFWQLAELVNKRISVGYLSKMSRLRILRGTYATLTLFGFGVLSGLLAPDLETFSYIFNFTVFCTVLALIGFSILAYIIHLESDVNPSVISVITVLFFTLVYVVCLQYIGAVGGVVLFALVIVILALNFMGTLWGYFFLLYLFIVSLLVGYNWQFSPTIVGYAAITDPSDFMTWVRGSVFWLLMAGLVAYTHIVVHGDLAKSLKTQAHVIGKLKDEKVRNAEIVSEQEAVREQFDIRHRLDLSQRIAGLLAHDLSNSMTPILGNVDLLLEKSQPVGASTQTFDSLKEIEAAALDIRVMLSELQKFNRESNAPLTSINMLVEIDRTLADLRSIMPADITLSFIENPDVAASVDLSAITIYGSPDLFRQLLEIVILAARASLDHIGVIRVAVTRERLSSDLVKCWGLQEYYVDSRWVELNIGLEGEVIDGDASLLFAALGSDVVSDMRLVGSSTIETKPLAFSMGHSLLKLFKAEIDHKVSITGEKSISIYFPSSQVLSRG
jgi:signal transduction histidine kinase